MAEENIKLTGTLLISAISPYNSTDKYPTHYAKYGHGGYRTVHDIIDLDKIPHERREEGMLVYVETDGNIYIYKNGYFQILGINNGNGIVPEEKNKLIYFDGERLVSEYLMYSEGLVVDKNEDFDLCKEGADVSMSTVATEWIKWGTNIQANNAWGYHSSEGNEPEVTDKGFTYVLKNFYVKGKPEGYIYNPMNPDEYTGFYSDTIFGDYTSHIASGVLAIKKTDPNDYRLGSQAGNTDYMGISPVLYYNIDEPSVYKFCGISISTMNSIDYTYNFGNGNKCGPSRDGIDDGKHTISIQVWYQESLNDYIGTTVNLLTREEGLSIIPYQEKFNNATSVGLASVIQTKIKKYNDVITLWFSDPYSTYDDDSEHQVYSDRPVIIDLKQYNITYTDMYGNTTTKDFSDNTNVVEIFNKLCGGARRGYETKSNPGSIFRNITSDELILNMSPDENFNTTWKHSQDNGWVNVTQEIGTPMQLFTGSKLSFNRITNKLFYSDGTDVAYIGNIGGGNINNGDGGSEYSAGTNISIENNTINVVGLPETYPPLNTDNFLIDGGKMTMVAHPFRFENGERKENNLAEGDFSTVVGFECKAYENAKNSFVGGDTSTVNNEVCFVHGKGLETGSSFQTVLGKYNKANNWGDTPLIIGWGEDTSNRKNLLVLQNSNTNTDNQSGDGGLMTYGPLKPGANYINDFSEYFEWFDGNPNNEDRVGYMVQLNGEKIELADSFEKCIGVISVTSAFVGNSCSLEWHGRYLKDDFGRIIYEEVDGKQVPKTNPNYNNSLEYIPRDRRKEWGNVGILGQILVRQDGTLEAGGYAGCLNGVATKSTDNKGYRVLKIVSDKVALVLVK